ncbi:RRQRL motif-containing zinc-binding protein [Streptomyces geranii]|uniref:RRQRL motif-containing zinc-binding protein n=1 Tax=Streptomyces geranii TaxID=2058923 RepID=UPI000D02302E|nr:RRQRL motif-containing zinc-binding protein [Streptomyces geranii]
MPRPRKKRRPREKKQVPRNRALLPEYDRGAVPEGLATRRQLRDMGLSPGSNRGTVAIVRCKWCSYRPWLSCNHPTRGFLLRVDLAKPKRIPTLAQEWALDRAMAARQTCGECGRRFYSCLSKKLGCCLQCHDGTPADPTSYAAPTSSPAHRLAA